VATGTNLYYLTCLYIYNNWWLILTVYSERCEYWHGLHVTVLWWCSRWLSLKRVCENCIMCDKCWSWYICTCVCVCVCVCRLVYVCMWM